jgi:hypothetical protein
MSLFSGKTIAIALACWAVNDTGLAQDTKPQSDRSSKQQTEQRDSARQSRQRGQTDRRRGDRSSKASLAVGDAAPNFDLKSFDGKTSTQLDSFKGKKPIVLFFGSYT